MEEYGVYKIPKEVAERNAVTGRFMKGHVPANKGKKWSDYLPKRTQKKCAKGWKNLELHRRRSPNAGRNKKVVIGVTPDGRWKSFESATAAGNFFGIGRSLICRCCRCNESGKVLDKGVNKGKINTDHAYCRVRWYFETNNVWMQKIKS